MHRPALPILLVFSAALGACEPPEGGASATAVAGAVPVEAVVADSTFVALVEGLSEPGGYFDTDNLISNEDSYLHVLGGLQELEVRGGAYIGVGPDQNFSYMARIRPSVAFVIDVRRDNLLQHLLFKALFTLAPTRIEYLSLLFGRPPPEDPEVWRDRPVEDLLRYLSETPATDEEAALREVGEAVLAFGVPMSERDVEMVEFIHRSFVSSGVDLKFTSHGRRPNPYYPSYRELILAEDLTGRRGNYLAREEDYRFLRELQLSHRVIPVVGDLGGDHALAAIGREIERRGEVVSAFYTSNVEYYLAQNGVLGRFARTAAALPRNERSVFIRSLFRRWHPQSQPGFLSTQLLQRLERFAEELEAGNLRTYSDVVSLGTLELH
jgi:hypothetical protein